MQRITTSAAVEYLAMSLIHVSGRTQGSNRFGINSENRHIRPLSALIFIKVFVFVQVYEFWRSGDTNQWLIYTYHWLIYSMYILTPSYLVAVPT
eukprot:SM000025S08378  [mRNA]  locus=s25:307046:307382:- [translate_table: standard]